MSVLEAVLEPEPVKKEKLSPEPVLVDIPSPSPEETSNVPAQRDIHVRLYLI